MQPYDKWRKALMETLRRLQANNRRHANAGYSPKQIFEQLLLIARNYSKCASRNLSLQLRVALKRAVAEGLLKLRAGRYTLKAMDKQKVMKKEPRHLQCRAEAVNNSLPSKTTKSKSSKKKKSTIEVKKRVKAKKSSGSKR